MKADRASHIFLRYLHQKKQEATQYLYRKKREANGNEPAPASMPSQQLDSGTATPTVPTPTQLVATNAQQEELEQAQMITLSYLQLHTHRGEQGKDSTSLKHINFLTNGVDPHILYVKPDGTILPGIVAIYMMHMRYVDM